MKFLALKKTRINFAIPSIPIRLKSDKINTSFFFQPSQVKPSKSPILANEQTLCTFAKIGHFEHSWKKTISQLIGV